MIKFHTTITTICFGGFIALLVAGAVQCDNLCLRVILFFLSGLSFLLALFSGYRLYKKAQEVELKKNKEGFPRLD
jgi:hypothetical protein